MNSISRIEALANLLNEGPRGFRNIDFSTKRKNTYFSGYCNSSMKPTYGGWGTVHSGNVVVHRRWVIK